LVVDNYRDIKQRDEALKRGATRHSNGFYPKHIDGLSVEWETWISTTPPPARPLTQSNFIKELATRENVRIT